LKSRLQRSAAAHLHEPTANSAIRDTVAGISSFVELQQARLKKVSNVSAFGTELTV
jgi:hypothetical protein